MFKVQKAKRQKLKAAVAFVGPSGSGKTLSALITAYGMMREKYPDLPEEEVWEKIGLIDTEHERSKVYVGTYWHDIQIGEFLFIDLTAPYTVKRYDEAVKAMVEAGAEVVIIDSISHAWESDGGLLELQQELGGRFQDWKQINPLYREFIKLVTGEKYRVHTLVTMRAKQDYQVERTDDGKLEVRKLGLKPVQRDSLEYEFQIVFNINMNHVAQTTKDNSTIFEGNPQKITPEIGAKLYQWLEAGIDVKAQEEEKRRQLLAQIEEWAANNEQIKNFVIGLEKKANRNLYDFNMKLLERAYELVEAEVAKLEVAAGESGA